MPVDNFEGDAAEQGRYGLQYGATQTQPKRRTLGRMSSGGGVVVQVNVLGSVGIRRNGVPDVELGTRLRRLLASRHSPSAAAETMLATIKFVDF